MGGGTGPLACSVCSLAPSYPGKLAHSCSPISALHSTQVARPYLALFLHSTHSTTQHLVCGRHSGNPNLLLDTYDYSFTLHLSECCSSITIGSVVCRLNGQILELDYLRLNHVPPLRVCVTLDKLSRLPELRGSILEVKERVPSSFWGHDESPIQAFFNMLAKPSSII